MLKFEVLIVLFDNNGYAMCGLQISFNGLDKLSTELGFWNKWCREFNHEYGYHSVVSIYRTDNGLDIKMNELRY